MNNAPAAFELMVPVEIRPCADSDLSALEWCGAFSDHREIIASSRLRPRQMMPARNGCTRVLDSRRMAEGM